MISATSKPVRRYLERHALHDPRLVDRAGGAYGCSVVVPICDEPPEFIDGIASAVDPSNPVLAIVVVNAREDADPAVHRANARVLKRLSEQQNRLEARGLSVMLVDRASRGRRFGPGQGVGFARRLGLDLALDAWSRGHVRSPWMHCTDADARLPAGHFAASGRAPADAVAMTFPFWHERSADPMLERATGLYELWLRYYVLGLHWAGSPYAHHAIGSALAVHGWAYAAVRGMPLRLAGEDFHLLTKLAKLGTVFRPDVEPVRIAARVSSRVPFGTGPGVARLCRRLESDEPIEFYDPLAFDLLRMWLQALERILAEQATTTVDEVLSGVAVPMRVPISRALMHLGIEGSLARVVRGAQGPAARIRRGAEWFDGLRTLRFLRALQNQGIGPRAWPSALRDAAFFQTADLDDGAMQVDDLVHLRRRALSHERALGSGLGQGGGRLKTGRGA